MRSKNFQNNGDNSRNGGKVFTGILIGSLIGAAVGMLLAKKYVRGSKIRLQMLRKRLNPSSKRRKIKAVS